MTTTITMPAVGQRVVATNVASVPHANNRMCVVREVCNSDIQADFMAYTDGDVTYPATSWFVSDWIAVGDSVIASDIPSFQHLSGQEVVVTNIDTHEGRPYYRAMFKDGECENDLCFYSATKVASTEPPATAEKTVGASSITIPANVTPSELEAIIERLSNDLAEANTRSSSRQTRIEELQRIVDNAHRCMDIIGDRLISESNDRDWCSEFDRIIDEVNGQLPSPFCLPVRNKDYEVTWTETYTVTVSRTETYTARDEDDAIAQAKQEDTVGSSEIIEAVREHNFSFDDDDNYEASEV